MTNDEIFVILDSVQSDEENDVENLLNDSDTEFECITKDAEDYERRIISHPRKCSISGYSS